jgi:hypothetical protein
MVRTVFAESSERIGPRVDFAVVLEDEPDREERQPCEREDDRRVQALADGPHALSVGGPANA